MTLLKRLTSVFMIGLASCLLAAIHLESELLSKSASVSYEAQIESSVTSSSITNPIPNLNIPAKPEFNKKQTHVVESGLVSDFLPPLTSEASSFSHSKQRPQFDPVELGIKSWLNSSNKIEIGFAQMQPVPWFINNRGAAGVRVSGWKDSNLNFNKHIYFI